VNYLLPPVPPRVIRPDERGKVVYLGICSGCHIYNGRMIGPPVQVIQALYMDNPQGIADYIAQPVKKRDDYPENAAAGLSRSRDTPRGGEVHAASNQLIDIPSGASNDQSQEQAGVRGRCGAHGHEPLDPGAGLALAQEAGSVKHEGLEEVVVTAQRREQALQDVPIALQVVGTDLIADIAAEDMGDLDGFVPGLQVSSDSPTQPRYAIRGIQTGDFGVGTDPAVGVYVDGIYAARSGASLLAFNDIERIEVLKGPQARCSGATARPARSRSSRASLPTISTPSCACASASTASSAWKEW